MQQARLGDSGVRMAEGKDLALLTPLARQVPA